MRSDLDAKSPRQTDLQRKAQASPAWRFQQAGMTQGARLDCHTGERQTQRASARKGPQRRRLTTGEAASVGERARGEKHQPAAASLNKLPAQATSWKSAKSGSAVLKVPLRLRT